MSRYRFINVECGHYPVRRLCWVLRVPASGYYAWQMGQQRAMDQQISAWETALMKAFGVHQRHYGTRRLQVTLRHNGHAVGRQRPRTTMCCQSLYVLQPTAYTPRTTNSTYGLRCAPNHLLDQPKPVRANQVCVSDSTYLPLVNGNWVVPGRAYLCAFQDMSPKYVVGWHAGATMP